jgi:hypothetical protein
MFVPLHDSTPLKVIRFQAVTIAVIVLEVAVYLATGAFSTDSALAATASCAACRCCPPSRGMLMGQRRLHQRFTLGCRLRQGSGMPLLSEPSEQQSCSLCTLLLLLQLEAQQGGI